MAAPQDANVLMFDLLKQMTNFVGILRTQLKPNEAAALSSTWVKVVKRLSIKISPPKAFEGGRDYERVATWLREVENFFPAMAVEEHQKVQIGARLLGGDVLTWWAKYIKDQEIVESERSRPNKKKDGGACLGRNSRLLSRAGLPQSTRTFVREWHGWI